MEQLVASTSRSVQEGEITWQIDPVSTLDQRAGVATGLDFAMLGHKWRINLYPGGYRFRYTSHLSVFLKLLEPVPDGVDIQFRFALVGTDGQGVSTSLLAASQPAKRGGFSRLRKFTTGHDSSWGYRRAFPRSALQASSQGFVCHDALTIQLQLRLFGPAIASVSDAPAVDRVPRVLGHREETVLRDLSALLASGMQSDAVVCASDGSAIPVHRAILAARSPVFKAMFAQPMAEAKDGRVSLDDVAPAIVDALLRFVYTGQCAVCAPLAKPSERKAKDQLAIDLLAVADRLQMHDLIDVCASQLMRSLTSTNLAERLVLADRCHAPGLKAHCIDYLRADPARLSAVMNSAGMATLGSPHLLDLLASLTPTRKRKRADVDDDTASTDSNGSGGALSSSGTRLTRANVQRLKVSELRDELSKRGLGTTGRKAHLAQRLRQSIA